MGMLFGTSDVENKLPLDESVIVECQGQVTQQQSDQIISNFRQQNFLEGELDKSFLDKGVIQKNLSLATEQQDSLIITNLG
jgi:hypothetical protein